ncbi:MAG: TonB-dependent receptor [Alphaproteobacteria bacterium]|nr:TonB-dependent receptor [Alphaproteobacteria bacterium]
MKRCFLKKACFLALAAALLISPKAIADAIPTIVVKPHRSAFEAENIPASINVIDRSEMEEKGMTEVQDALEDIPGAILTRSDTPGGVSSLFLRGTESSHTLVLLDGMPINDPSGTTGAYNFAEDLLGEIGRIEVIRGPGALEYGSAAIGGVVNLVSRTPSPDVFSKTMEAYGGSQGTFGGQGLASGTIGDYSYLLSIEGRHADGVNTLPERFPNNPKDSKGSDTETVFAKVGYSPNPATRLGAQVRWRNADFELNDQAVSTPAYFGSSAALNWQLHADREWGERKSLASLSLAQTRTNRFYRNDPDAADFAAGSSWLRAKYAGTRTIARAQNKSRFPSVESVTNISLTTGLSFAHETADINYRSDSLYGPFAQMTDNAASETGLFAKIEGRALGRIDLTSGIRGDFPESYASRATTYAGGVLQLPEIQARVKSSFGTSFRTPSLFECYGIDSYGLVGNVSLRPETAQSWDAGVEKEIPLFGNARFASVETSYFETSTRRLIQYEFGTPPQYRNIGRAEISGVENRIKVFPAKWMEADLGWTWTNAINASGDVYSGTPPGGELLRRPKNTASGSMTFRPTSSWRITPKFRFIGPRYDQLYNDSGVFTGRGRIGGYVLADLSADFRLSENLNIYMKTRNIFDRRIESPNGYLLEPLTVLVGLRYE